MHWLLSSDRICDGLTISALFSGLRGLGTRPGRVFFDVISGWIGLDTFLYCASLGPGPGCSKGG